MANTTQIFGNPSWSAEVLPDGMAFIRVTYPAGFGPAGSSVATYQTLRLPMEDPPELAAHLNNLIAWKPSAHQGEGNATHADEASHP
jgi:hypothetical protein